MLVGAASGAIAGVLVGGIGGRLAMLVLRVTSPDVVVGLTSDDGFEIGVVSTRTLSLLVATAMIGGISGVLYALLRGMLPRRLRLPLWTLCSAAVVGAVIVHEDGIDFTVLEPAALAIAFFVALPGLGAALTVWLVERWADREPFSDRRLSVLLALAALAGTFACVAAVAAASLAAVGSRAAGAARLLGPAARVAVPLALAAVTVGSTVELVAKASRLV